MISASIILSISHQLAYSLNIDINIIHWKTVDD